MYVIDNGDGNFKHWEKHRKSADWPLFGELKQSSYPLFVGSETLITVGLRQAHKYVEGSCIQSHMQFLLTMRQSTQETYEAHQKRMLSNEQFLFPRGKWFLWLHTSRLFVRHGDKARTLTYCLQWQVSLSYDSLAGPYVDHWLGKQNKYS